MLVVVPFLCRQKTVTSNANHSEVQRESGFGIVEVIVSIFLLGILGMLIAGGLIQAILANARNTFIVAVTQRSSEEITRLQAADMKCSDLQALVTAVPTTLNPPITPNEVVTFSVVKVGTWTCTSSTSSYYPVQLLAKSKGETLFSSEFLIGTIKETSG